MANQDVLRDVLLQMQNLKLSSPLRSDPVGDDNKENILAGQDNQKAKIEDKDSDKAIIKQTEETDENLQNCQLLNGIDVNGKDDKLDQLIPAALIFENNNSESLVHVQNAVNAIVTSEVNDICSNEAVLNNNLSNCEQNTSTQSLYNDCIEILGKEAGIETTEIGDLNSTSQVEKSSEEPESLEVTLKTDDISLNSPQPDSTRVLCERETTETSNYETNLNETFQGCDQTFVSHSINTEVVGLDVTFTNNFADIPDSTIVENKEWKDYLNNGETLLNLETTINRSVEDVEKSTAELDSDSSDRSSPNVTSSTELNVSLDKTQIPENIDSSINEAVKQAISVNVVEKENSLSKNSSIRIEEPLPENTLNTSSSSLINTVEKGNNKSTSITVLETNSSVEIKEPLPENRLSTSSESQLSTKEVENKPNSPTVFIDIQNIPKKMENISEKFQQEFSDVKLELNAVQQAKAILELELSKKEEIILRTQAEAMKKEQQLMQDNKALRKQLKERENSIIEKDTKESEASIKDLEEALKEAKIKEAEFIKVLEEYEKTIASRFADYKKLKEENSTLSRHLTSLESSFSDLLQKYEKSKAVVLGFKRNEEKLVNAFEVYKDTFAKQEARYESLKAHAQSQIDKCNIEINQYKEKSEMEISKLKAITKRLEIENAALQTSVEQKTKECLALAALFDEVTGKKN